MEEEKEIQLVLTKEDLEGDFLYASDCPIARALRRKFPTAVSVSGGPWRARVDTYRFKINREDENRLLNDDLVAGDVVRLTPLQTVECDCC